MIALVKNKTQSRGVSVSRKIYDDRHPKTAANRIQRRSCHRQNSMGGGQFIRPDIEKVRDFTAERSCDFGTVSIFPIQTPKIRIFISIFLVL